jgi:hypothetical protein
MTLDIEFTINRWGLGMPAANKVQAGPFRLAVWRRDRVAKHAISFEVGWRLKDTREDTSGYVVASVHRPDPTALG